MTDKFVIFSKKRGKGHIVNVYWEAETYDSTFLNYMPDDVKHFKIGDKRKLTRREILSFTKHYPFANAEEAGKSIIMIRDCEKSLWVIRTFISEEDNGSSSNPRKGDEQA